jgi:adenylate cyclase
MPENESRRLAAILAADIAGYSALMGADEARTVRDLKGHQAVVLPMVAEFSGRIIDTAGDGILAEFPSVLNAVKCAVAIQTKMAERNATVEPERRMLFRVGINMGDVVYDEARIYGDGINVAARLEGITEAGGICLSSKVYEEINGRIDLACQDIGEQQFKNIARPVRAYRVCLDTVAPTTSPALAVPDKPSIAVLPFTNMSGDAEQEYFSDGISEDIITDLSKITGLMVIARNSTFTYKGTSINVKRVGRDLGVRYVLEGSVRKVGNRVRITGQLIDTVTGGHLWAERYDRDLTDILEIQDDVTRRIVDALKVTLSPAENARLVDSVTHNIDAYDLFLRGREFLLGENKDRDKFEQSLKLFTRALELDPNYSKAYAGLSWAYNFDYSNRWTDNPDNSLHLAKHNAERAIQKDPNEPLARFAASLAAMCQKDLDRAKSEADIALSLNPNFAQAHATLGAICTYSGQPLAAISAIEHAIRLDPAWSQQYLHFLGTAYLLAGKYETAAALLRQRVSLVPGTDFTRAVLASALGHLNEIDEARRIWRELKEINPKYSFSEHFARQPFKREDDFRLIAEGLEKAGLST